jgi:hypothetical protein
MFVTIMPALFLTLTSVAVNLFFFYFGLLNIEIYPELMRETTNAVLMSAINSYLVLFAMGLLTTITEWKNINCSAVKKIKYVFSFPIFIFTYVPISIVALFKFKKIEWKPITHSITITIEDIQQ